MKSTVPTVPSYIGGGDLRHERDVRRSNPLLTVGVVAIALLLLALVCIAGYFVFKQSGGTESAQTNQGSPTVKEGAGPRTNVNRQKNDPANVPDDQSSPETTQPINTTPLKINATSSSVRLAVQANTYFPANAIDGRRTTAWIEGVDGAGIGEWIRFDFDREITVHRILIQPGYFKSPQIWSGNNRLAAVTAQFSDGSSQELTFSDRMESQKVDVGTVRTKWVRFVIKSVYYGADPDTAVSEVAFEWEP